MTLSQTLSAVRGAAFFLSLKRELVLSSAAISLVFGASRLEGGIEGPLVGYLIHKPGPKKMIAFGSALTGAGLLIPAVLFAHLRPPVPAKPEQ
jgi:hypothetical protein